MAKFKVEIKEITAEEKYGTTIYEQVLDNLDVSKIVTYLNQPTPKATDKVKK